MADSMTNDAGAKPGPRIQIGVFTSNGTCRYAWRTLGMLYIIWPAPRTASENVSYDDVSWSMS